MCVPHFHQNRQNGKGSLTVSDKTPHEEKRNPTDWVTFAFHSKHWSKNRGNLAMPLQTALQATRALPTMDSCCSACSGDQFARAHTSTGQGPLQYSETLIRTHTERVSVQSDGPATFRQSQTVNTKRRKHLAIPVRPEQCK